ncbi:MAG: hypothetical protein IJ411_00225 [Oscillospiraceae bacterium]|nr:hypothetical protein [Oscillospiraceae bacterium]
MKKVIALALSMMMIFAFAACESNTEAAESTTTEAATETTTEATEESTAAAGVEESAVVEAVKAANGKVVDVAFADAEADMTITVTMAADATEEDVNAAYDALTAEVGADEFVATNFFHNTEENVNKTFTVNFVLDGSSDVAYTAGSTFSAGKGRKGVLYTRTVAWSAPEAPAAE